MPWTSRRLNPAATSGQYSLPNFLVVDVTQAISVRRDSAVKLIDGLAGESPASAGCPVGTVVISGDGAGDQTVGSALHAFLALLLARPT